MSFQWSRVNHFLLLLFFAVLPWSKALVSILLVACLISGLFVFDRKQWSKAHFPRLLLLPILYFMWHLIGMIWTSNTDFGWFDCKVKLLLSLVPCMVYLQVDSIRLHLEKYVLAFYLGIAACLTTLLAFAWFRILKTGGVEEFFYTRLSMFMHPSYFAWYINTAILLLIFSLGFRSGDSWLRWALIVFFTLGVLLLNSKAGIFGWGLVVLLSFGLKWIESKRRYYIFSALLWCIIFATIFKIMMPAGENRMGQFKHALSDSSSDYREMESTSTRVQVWHSSWQLIVQQPWLGTGTGDVKDELVAAYEREGFSFAAAHRFNSHNQFLQSWLALGIIGLLILLALLILPVWSAFYARDPFLIVFTALAMFNMLVESMLEKQDGVVFFALFYSVFLITFKNPNDTGETSDIRQVA